MAYQMIATNGQVQYNVNEFVVDTVEDLKKLPLKSLMGSTALCLSNSEVYVKNSKGQWVPIGDSSGSGSGGSSSGGTGVTSYNDLTDKPVLNGTVLQGEVDINTIPISTIDDLGNSLQN